jgi:hypothetical protein
MPIRNSFVHFHNGQIRAASNDGMELLGHFLLAQIGTEPKFFIELAEDTQDRATATGPYFVETLDDVFTITHLENERVQPFETSKANMIDILKRWEGFCKNPASGACTPLGQDLIIIKSQDEQSFYFDTGLSKATEIR